jgi:outer membrane protein OmpA-like peptidoglycan-associated protein
MTRTILLALFLVTMLAGCATKENLIVLDKTADGTVGALQVSTDKGSQVLAESGTAVRIENRDTSPSPPAPITSEESQRLFADALQVHPLMPESFLLYFKLNSNELTDESQRLIATIVAAVQRRQSKDISVIGHTDRLGSDEHNRRLSMERAKVVYNLLSAASIAESDMTIIYHGEGNPLVPTADNVAEPRNRRVEVMVR